MTEQITEIEKKAPSFLEYSKDETDYLIGLAQLVNQFPSGDVRDGKLAFRLFTTLPGRLVIAIVVSELPDSFVIILPHSFKGNEDGSWEISPNSTGPLFRMYKTIVGGSALPEMDILLPYLSVVKRSMDKLPGFFNETRKAQVDSLITQIREMNGFKAEDEVSSTDHPLFAKGFTPPDLMNSRTKH